MTFTVRHLLLYTLIFTVLFFVGIITGFDAITVGILSIHYASLDTLLIYITKWAEWPVIVLALSLAFYHLGRKGWLWAFAFVLEGLFIQGAKIWINWPRPAIKFPEHVRHINGVTLSQWKAFPSGHTAAAFFATAIILSLWQSNWPKILKYILIIMAFAVAYSRIYLGQHSFEDVLAGALVGLWLFWAFYQLFHYKKWLNP
jgi:membrane-associated phospholipid phosphatase